MDKYDDEDHYLWVKLVDIRGKISTYMDICSTLVEYNRFKSIEGDKAELFIIDLYKSIIEDLKDFPEFETKSTLQKLAYENISLYTADKAEFYNSIIENCKVMDAYIAVQLEIWGDGWLRCEEKFLLHDFAKKLRNTDNGVLVYYSKDNMDENLWTVFDKTRYALITIDRYFEELSINVIEESKKNVNRHEWTKNKDGSSHRSFYSYCYSIGIELSISPEGNRMITLTGMDDYKTKEI